MNIGYHRYIKCLMYLAQDTQRFFIADTGKGVEARTVGLTVRTFEYIGDIPLIRDFYNRLGYTHGHLLTFDDTRPGHEEKEMRIGMFQLFELGIHNYLFRSLFFHHIYHMKGMAGNHAGRFGA